MKRAQFNADIISEDKFKHLRLDNQFDSIAAKKKARLTRVSYSVNNSTQRFRRSKEYSIKGNYHDFLNHHRPLPSWQIADFQTAHCIHAGRPLNETFNEKGPDSALTHLGQYFFVEGLGVDPSRGS